MKEITSAVRGMSVSDMRKLLGECRTLISQQTIEDPFCMHTLLSNSQPVHEFVINVAFGMHEKRSKFSKKTSK
jgi:hypothetical protein